MAHRRAVGRWSIAVLALVLVSCGADLPDAAPPSTRPIVTVPAVAMTIDPADQTIHGRT